MKVHILALLIFFVVLFSACQKPVLVVESTFSDGQKKHVEYYMISGQDSTVVKEAFFYKSGALYIEGALKEGERDGLWKSFREDGQIWSETEYSEGKENGFSRTYHDNGKLYYEGEYSHGKRLGIWNFYKKDGSILKSIDYSKSVNN